MKINEINVGDYFISSMLPLNRAVFYGVTVIEKNLGSDDLKKILPSITLERKNKTGHEDTFNLRGDETGEINLGKWIKV